MANDQKSVSPAPLWPYLLLCAATALWIDLGTIHRQHHADSIVPILTSLYHWTPYYWGTNRNGNLVPLLAIPFQDPLVNLLVQDGLVIFSGLATLFLLPRYVLRDARWPYAAIVSTAVFLVFAPEDYRFSFLVDQPYAVSLALGLGGLVLAEDMREAKFRIPRFVLALLFIGLAHWVNVGIGLLLGILVVFRALSAGKVHFQGRDEETSRALILLAIGFGLGLMGMQLAPYHETAEGITSPDQWLPGWSRLAGNTWTALAPHHGPIFLAMTATLVLVLSACLQPLGEYASTSLHRAAVFLLTTILYGAFVCTLEWVERGSFMARYSIPLVILIHTGLSVVAAAPLGLALEARPWQGFCAVAPLVLLAASYSYGYPSPSGVQDDLAERMGSRTADVLAARCTHVAGNYWVVWPTVFHANLVRSRRGRGEVIWGVSFRSEPMRHQINQVPISQQRIAIPHGDTEAVALLQDYGFSSLVVAEMRPTVAILCPKIALPITSR